MEKNSQKNMQEADNMMNNAAADNGNVGAGNMTDNLTKNNNAEADTMANGNNKTLDNTMALDGIPFGDLMEMIPEDERAVTGADPIEGIRIVVVDSVAPLDDLMSEIPEEERACEEESPVGLSEVTSYGFFTPAVGMRCFTTNTGHRLYAKISTDPKAGQVIRYRQQYADGRFSDEMTLSQADLVLAATYRFTSDRIADTTLRNVVGKFIVEASRDYYGRLLYPREGLEITAILNMLVNKFGELPIEKNMLPLLEQPRELYGAIIQTIRDKRLDVLDEKTSYYTLDREQMETLAAELGTTRIKLCNRMREYHFLYLTDCSKGYQSNIRFKPYGEFFPNPHSQWMYCILKLDVLMKRRMQKQEKSN
ncbi:MAG: hypothetical protein NC307_14535 [Roseburia sp.]|nr:hypothetical protein [Roseburia sp.]